MKEVRCRSPRRSGARGGCNTVVGTPSPPQWYTLVSAFVTLLLFIATAVMAGATFKMATASEQAVEAATRQAKATLSIFAAERIGMIDRQAKLITDLLSKGNEYCGIMNNPNPETTVLWQDLCKLRIKADELFMESTYEESRSAYDWIQRFFASVDERNQADALNELNLLEKSPAKLKALRDGLKAWVEKPAQPEK